MKQRARTAAEKEARKKKLLDSARTVFPRQGYAKTTVEMITGGAGIRYLCLQHMYTGIILYSTRAWGNNEGNHRN